MYARGKIENNSKEVLELTRMTKKGIQALCKKNKLYHTPELNDVLYLHYQGYRDIECLEEYTGLKCLWLENNAISEIAGLDHQKLLKCLFLNNNLIKKIENLENCPELDTLNLANNHITRIENCGVDKLPVLTTLILSHNYIKNAEQLGDIVNCKMLSVLDLAHNRIEDILVVKVFAQMPELRVLDLDGNPVVNKIPQYRKTLILECKNLTHLDRRPVFPRDRACAVAWKRGGYEEERREHNRWNKADRRKIRESVNATLRLRNRGGGDPQVDLIPSSGDEDETERSSAPPSEPPPKQQMADSLSIDENVQYVEYYDPESLPQPEGHREMRKCKTCGRVECIYDHTEKRPAVQKVLEAPEDILAKSQAVIEGKDMGNTEPKTDEQESDVVNIPNIFSVRYESENEGEPNSMTKQQINTTPNQEADEENTETSNINKDDLYEKAYVNYLDTVDRLLYIESKVEATKLSLSEETKEEPGCLNTSPNEVNLTAKALDDNTNTDAEQHKLELESSNQESSPCQESYKDPSKSSVKEDCQSKLSEPTEIISLKCEESDAKPMIKDLFESKPIATPNKPVPPPSEKKKVRLMIEAEVPEKHVKIPTTPIPNRKGRKIDYKHVQDATKRTKLDRGKSYEDMLDIFSDWTGNLKEFDKAQEGKVNAGNVSSKLNLLSSTFNDSVSNSCSTSEGHDVIHGFEPEEAAILSLVNNELCDTYQEIPKDVSETTKPFNEYTKSCDSSEGSHKESDDDSNAATEGAEKTITSIRDFVSSYDAFLHSIEGRLHDLSERCKISCVPPENLTEESLEQEVKQNSLPLSSESIMNEPENKPHMNLTEDGSQVVDIQKVINEVLCKALKTETNSLVEKNSNQIVSIQETNVGTEKPIIEASIVSTDDGQESRDTCNVSLHTIHEEIESQIQFSGDNMDSARSKAPEAVENQTSNHLDTSKTMLNKLDDSADLVIPDCPKSKEPTYLPELVSTDEKLQGYYTEVGRRNSEIIQRLLENPLTKKMSAEEICKDLHETTEEIRRLNREKQKHREENTKEMVEVVYSHKDDYDGELEVVDNKLVIIHKKSSEIKDITLKDAFLHRETQFSTVKTSEVIEEGACKPDSSSESWDEMTEDLTELFEWNERTTELKKRVELERGIKSKFYKNIDSNESFQDSYKVQNKFGEITHDFSRICDVTYDCLKSKDVQRTVSEEIYSHDTWVSTSNTDGHQINTHTRYETHTERLAESPCSGIMQHEDSSEVYQEALSSYVISETSDGLEVFEPAQCEVNSPSSDGIADKYSRPHTSPCELKVCETENVWFDSTSSCDVLLGTTFESTLSSSCWDAEDEETSNSNLDKYFEEKNIKKQVEKPSDEKEQSEPVEATSSDKEDSESHPVNFCPTAHGGRYTI